MQQYLNLNTNEILNQSRSIYDIHVKLYRGQYNQRISPLHNAALRRACSSSLLLYADATQAETHRFANGCETALQAGSPQLLTAAAVDGEAA